ncbi:MAG: hypothetical protein R3282_08495, partial [Rhodothermales bacterium]|nr:hypothetical protein [Rhodothermales bacterium]
VAQQAADPPRHAPAKIDPERSQTPLWQQYRAVKPSTSKAAPDLHELELAVLGSDAAGNRRSFIGELFGGEEDAYLATIGHLARTKTWSEASQVIAEQVFKRYQINIYSEPAVAFTNAVEAKFRTRGVGA